MTDPFSITVGVVGLLSTLAGVSVQLNDMRKEFMEAENEIDSLLRELTDLTNVLSKLQAAQGGLSLPHTLSRDLAGLLRNCSGSATEAEILLRKSSARRFRAAYWSFSGKKECLQLCRGLEAYKATLNIALNVYSAQMANEILDKTDQILSEIKTTQRMVPAKDYILQRFLDNAEAYTESAYEGTTVGDKNDTSYFQLEPEGSNPDLSPIPSEPLFSPSPINLSAFSTESQPGPQSSSSSGGTPILEMQESSRKASDATNSSKFPRAEIYYPQKTLCGHSDSIHSVQFSADGKTLASGSWDTTIKIWSAAGLILQTLSGHSLMIYSVAFSPNGRKIASGSADQTIKLWDAASGWPLQTLSGHQNSVSSVAFSPDSRRIASGSIDETVKLWDAATAKVLQTLSGHAGGIWSVAFSPNGRWIASGSRDRTVRLWDAATGAGLMSLNEHSGDVWSVAFSADSRRLASGSQDRTARLWDSATGSLLHTLNGHSETVLGVSFSHDGEQLASSSEDHTVRLWDVMTGSNVQTLKGHGDSVYCVAFSHDKRLASGSKDKSVMVWDRREETLLALDQMHY